MCMRVSEWLRVSIVRMCRASVQSFIILILLLLLVGIHWIVFSHMYIVRSRRLDSGILQTCTCVHVRVDFHCMCVHE